jgi:hypothetical protein
LSPTLAALYNLQLATVALASVMKWNGDASLPHRLGFNLTASRPISLRAGLNNLSAVLTALAHHFPRRTRVCSGSNRARRLSHGESHHSFVKSA